MGLFLLNIEDYFSNEPNSELYINKHRPFLDDLYRWAPLCSAAFERATYISGCYDTKVYFLSNSFIAISGYTKEEITKKADNFLLNIIHPADIKYIGNVYKELMNYYLTSENKLNHTKYFARYNMRIKNKAGKWINLECYSYPIYTINKKVHFCITHTKVSMEKFTPLFQIYFTEENKRFIFQEKKGIFFSSTKADLKDIEIRVLLNTAKGLKEHEIARDMHIELNTIKYYKKGILNKLSVNSMPEAIYYALKNKII
ncbi:MAG: LuxR C-terminal-related transcriptional regulator [Bacteroidales bacterium]